MLRHLGAADEAQVAGARVRRVDVARREARLEVVGVQRLVPVDRVVAARVVRAVHPDLQQARVLSQHKAARYPPPQHTSSAPPQHTIIVHRDTVRETIWPTI